MAYENTCGKCHTPTLTGRKGDPGELPPLSSLSGFYRKFIGARGFSRSGVHHPLGIEDHGFPARGHE